MDLSFGYILFVLPPGFPVETVIIRAMKSAAMRAPTPVLAAAHPLRLKAPGQRFYGLLFHKLLR